MKRALQLFSLLLLAVVLAAGCEGEKKPGLKLGSLGPLTGKFAADGRDIRNGVLTAMEVMGPEMGSLGPVTLQAEDEACDPRQAVAAANRLINEKVVAVIGAYCPNALIPAAEPLMAARIIMLTPAASTGKVTESGHRYLFRTCGRDDDQSRAAVRFMQEQLKARGVFIIDDKGAGQALAESVEQLCLGVGLKVLGRSSASPGEANLSALLAKVKAARPDVIYLSLRDPATAAALLGHLPRLGLKARVLAPEALRQPQLLELAKKQAEGLYLSFAYTDKESPAYLRFHAAHKARFGEPGPYAAYAYDAAVAYLKAAKAAGGTEPEQVKAELLKLDFAGASKQIRFKDNGDSGSSFVVQVVQGGRFVNHWSAETGQLLQP